MNHFTFAGNLKESYPTAILIKDKHFKPDQIKKYYVDPLVKLGVPIDSLITFNLDYPNDKVTATQAKKYLGYLLPALVKVGVSNLLVADATYYKILTGQKKADQNIGYVHPCVIKGFTHINVAFTISYGALLHNPNQISRIDLSLQAMASHLNGTLVPLGEDVLVNPIYRTSLTSKEAQLSLDSLLAKPMITCDIETYGLQLDKGIGSIAFSWNQNEGVAFLVKTEDDLRAIKMFFERYRGTVIYHNATFDIKHIIYNCFMKDPLDKIGMLHGLEVMTKSIHDTKVIAYLAVNSTAGNELGLKVLAQPYMGNWGVDVTDITKLSNGDLLKYNIGDCVATYYVFNTYLPLMLKDDQKDIYETIMIPSIKLIIQMELHGMPIDMEQVLLTEQYLKELEVKHLDFIMNHSKVKDAELIIQTQAMNEANAKLKTKQHPLSKYSSMVFNPGSPKQLGVLIYDVLKLPEVDLTPTGNPATGAKVLEKLVNHTSDKDTKELLNNLIGLSKVTKILGTFIPAFKAAQEKEDGHYLHGSFNLGGAMSGRMSSSSPNLQNLPSGSTHGKIIKSCFRAKSGWLFVASDFASLEDKINALLTKDENKLRVYTDKFDGHSLRAYSYWGDQMPDIHQATNEKCYMVDGASFKETDIINYQGTKYTGQQFYDLFN